MQSARLTPAAMTSIEPTCKNAASLYRRAAIALTIVCVLCSHAAVAASQDAASKAAALPTQVGVQVKLESFTPGDADAIRAAGLSFVRFGIWTNALHDSAYRARIRAAFSAASNASLPVLVTLRSTSTLVSTDPSIPIDAALQSASEQFAAAVLEIEREFRPHILAIELWNEPDLGRYWPTGDVETTFAPFMRAVCSQLAARTHAVPVYGFGLSRPPAGGTLPDSLLQATLGKPQRCVDAISYHAYGMTPAAILAASRDIRKRYGLPAVITEWGVPSAGTIGGTSAQTRRVRDFLAALPDMETPLVSLYEWKDTPTGTNLRERNYGLVVTADRPKPALQAVRDSLPKR
jgi:polysaccharide biosynthesis protein PslG